MAAELKIPPRLSTPRTFYEGHCEIGSKIGLLQGVAAFDLLY